MTGSTTVDSNFLLAHKEQLDEVFQVYLDDINPFIVQFEILKNEFPIELQNPRNVWASGQGRNSCHSRRSRA